MEYKVDQPVWEIRINKPSAPSRYETKWDKEGITVVSYKILGISELKICLNDNWFTTFSHLEKGKRRESYHSYLNDISVNIKTKQDFFSNGVFTSMYSTKKPSKVIINKMVGEACRVIDKEYGFLMGSIKGELHELAESFKTK